MSNKATNAVCLLQTGLFEIFFNAITVRAEDTKRVRERFRSKAKFNRGEIWVIVEVNPKAKEVMVKQVGTGCFREMPLCSWQELTGA